MDNGEKKKIIDEGTVRYAAGLSRLELGPDEIKGFQEQLARILDYVAQLNEVDTQNTPPTTHVLSSMKNVFREDEPEGSLAPEKALENAPAREKNFFKVPKIIKDF